MKQHARVALVAAVMLPVLAACGGSGSSNPPGTPSGASSGSNEPGGPTITMPSQDRTLPTFTDGVGMSEWLPAGPLNVRALDYQKAAVKGSGTTRLDAVTVEECAVSTSVPVKHTSWHLVDSAGKTLGVAGGKIVDGHATEDIPQTLSPGQCLQTTLIIGVPPGSTPTAVKDGPDDSWVLAD